MGLFVGAVVLALGYNLFQWWLAEDETDEVADEGGGPRMEQPAVDIPE